MTQTEPPTEALISSKEAAERLGMDRSHFNTLVRNGFVPVAQRMAGTTGAYLFHASAIEDLKSRREGAVA